MKTIRMLALSAVSSILFATSISTQGALRKATAVVDLQSAIAQTAAVVEGTVTDIRHEYSDAEGPWTHVTLSGVKSHFGNAPATVEIRHFGGPLPNGRQLVVAELPVFVQGKSYLVFLRNTEWNLSPVLGDLALRREMIGETEVLVNSDGLAITGVGPSGVEVGPALFEGPKGDGSKSKALDRSSLASFERRPLDRQGFVQALHTAMAGSRLSVDGAVAPLPAGEFKWRAVPTAATADSKSNPTADAATPDRATLEVDASRPAGH